MEPVDFLNLNSYNFDFSEELIARYPADPRDSSKLMVFDKSASSIKEVLFRDIVDFLPKNSLIVFNETRVLPARVFIDNKEIFFLEMINENTFVCLVRPGRFFKKDKNISLNGFNLNVLSVEEDGSRVVEVSNGTVVEFLDKCGTTPLPPYMKHKAEEAEQLKDKYQTVFAKKGTSIAAPTAGLHFTEDLLSKLEEKGHGLVKVNLNIGYGTFEPIKVDNILEHKMHTESYVVSKEAADVLNNARENGQKIICVGTTSLRCLQSCYDYEKGLFEDGESETDIFIYPGFEKFVVDGLVTNFHLPKSSLLMLVAAFIGYENVMNVYKKAVENKYRFYSFGDACLFLRS